MKRLLLSIAILAALLPIATDARMTTVVVGGATASGGGGPDTYYYSYGGDEDAYTTCDDWPSTGYHNGGLVTVTTGGTATSFGIKVGLLATDAVTHNIGLYNESGTTRLGYCNVQTSGSVAEVWLECTSQSIAVSSSTTYLILWSSSDATNIVRSCFCSGAPDCTVADGKYSTDDYNADPATGSPATVTGLSAEGNMAIGVRIYVD